jgi:antitoxin MazE
MAATPLELGESVEVREEAGRIVIEPIRQKAYDIKALIKYNHENLHEAVDFGAAVGKKVW